MRLITIILFVLTGNVLAAQNGTDVSLFFKNDSNHYLNEVSSVSGDLFNILGHHGPAVENEWIGLRIYFDKKAAIDVYSKTKPGLELKGARWYPTAYQQKEGWGADYYKAGETVGLGGIRLWDGKKVVPLEPVSRRYARVVKEATGSYMEMLSEDIPYKNGKVDILVRVTVFPKIRNAKVEAFALTDNDVQFVTGINHHKNQKVIVDEHFIMTWGFHPEDVAAENVELGAAIIFDKNDYLNKIDDGQQHLLISKPTRILEYWITSANAKEPVINDLDKFLYYIKH
jgi:hypothetical protein